MRNTSKYIHLMRDKSFVALVYLKVLVVFTREARLEFFRDRLCGQLLFFEYGQQSRWCLCTEFFPAVLYNVSREAETLEFL